MSGIIAKSSKRPSRFGGSSDEDEPRPSEFRSRFVDSSDEEDARPASSSVRPISSGTLRGSATAPIIASRAATVPEERESPELPDSDDETMHIPSPFVSPHPERTMRPASQRGSSGIGTSTLRRSGSGRGTIPVSATMPITAAMPITATKARRSSLMGSILKRNKKADHGGKIQRSDLTDSAARRDTKLERSPQQLHSLRMDSPMQPGSPKLQKKNRGDSWPLPEPDRPSTAGGYEVGKEQPPRPDFAGRRSTSLGLPGQAGLGIGTATILADLEEESVAGTLTGTAKKKKKFGALRRMFRLDD